MFGIKKMIKQKPKKFNKILIFSLIVLIFVALVFLPNITFADWASELLENESYAKNISQLIDAVSHVVYVFIWPCLAIAWSALDNSLIYGSFLHLDAALRNIWNIMKNFANFALWFIFIFTIVKNLFAWSFGSSNYDPVKGARDTIVKTLIAWVLVQISWFLIAVLIDLSTILIYVVWWIPLSMLWSYNKEVADFPIMKLNVEIDDSSSFSYYSYWWYNFSPCLLAGKKGDVKDEEKISLSLSTWEYVVWRRYLYLSDWVPFETWYCVLNGYLYKYVESMTWFFCSDGPQCYSPKTGSVSAQNSWYFGRFKEYLTALDSWKVVEWVNSCNFVNAYNYEYTWQAGQPCALICSGYWEVSYTGDIFAGNTNGFSLKQLMENSKWWVWPFITMYSSILDYQDLVMHPGNESVIWTLFGFIINTFFAFVLFIPIAILMVLLILRVWYLWIVVAISPILILVNYGPLWDKIKNNEIFKKFTPKEILTKIFSPIIVVFAVSLCIVILSTIFKSKPNKNNASTTLSAFWIEKVETPVETPDSGGGWSTQESCIMPNWNGSEWWKNVSSETYSILWLVDIKLNVQNYNHGKDMFAWVLLELLATWIVRFFMKFAIWMMWERWKKLMGNAEKLITNYPLITLPWWWKVGVGAFGIWEGNEGRLSHLMDQKIDNIVGLDEQNSALNKFFNLEENSTESEESVTEVINYIRNNNTVSYENLWAERQKVLATVYWSEDKAKEKFDELKTYVNADKTVPAENIAKIMWTWIIEAGKSLSSSPDKSKTNVDALKFTKDQLDIAVRSDPNWIAWARGMIWGSVHTMDGVFIVDVVKWTELNNPQYKIASRDEYEEAHFGKPVENITKEEYDKKEQGVKDKLDEYLKHLENVTKDMDDMKKTKDTSWKLSEDDSKKLDQLSKFMGNVNLKNIQEKLSWNNSWA